MAAFEIVVRSDLQRARTGLGFQIGHRERIAISFRNGRWMGRRTGRGLHVLHLQIWLGTPKIHPTRDEIWVHRTRVSFPRCEQVGRAAPVAVPSLRAQRPARL
jgi:hypothetical protein